MDKKGDMINVNDERAVRQEILNVEMDIRNGLEKFIQEREMPEVKVRKSELRSTHAIRHWGNRGLVSPDEEVVIKPVKHESKENGSDWWKRIDWQLSKEAATEALIPEIVCEEVKKEDWGKYENILFRGYSAPIKNETAYVFRNTQNEIVGWYVGTAGSENNFHLRFIGVSDGMERQGYGSAMLDHMKSRYESIGFTVNAFAREGNWQVAQDNLYKFYAKNGFRMASDGMGWSKSDSIFEGLRHGGSLRFSDEVTIGGDNVSSGKVMELYFGGLERDGKLDEVMGDKADAARSWMKMRKEEERIFN